MCVYKANFFPSRIKERRMLCIKFVLDIYSHICFCVKSFSYGNFIGSSRKIKNAPVTWVVNNLHYTTAHPWCVGYSTSISTYRV